MTVSRNPPPVYVFKVRYSVSVKGDGRRIKEKVVGVFGNKPKDAKKAVRSFYPYSNASIRILNVTRIDGEIKLYTNRRYRCRK